MLPRGTYPQQKKIVFCPQKSIIVLHAPVIITITFQCHLLGFICHLGKDSYAMYVKSIVITVVNVNNFVSVNIKVVVLTDNNSIMTRLTLCDESDDFPSFSAAFCYVAFAMRLTDVSVKVGLQQ